MAGSLLSSHSRSTRDASFEGIPGLSRESVDVQVLDTPDAIRVVPELSGESEFIRR